MGAMGGPEAGRKEHLDRLAEHLLPRITEELLGLRIDHDDRAVLVDDDQGIRYGLHELLLYGLRLLARRLCGF